MPFWSEMANNAENRKMLKQNNDRNSNERWRLHRNENTGITALAKIEV
jgi:hypothetical protein